KAEDVVQSVPARVSEILPDDHPGSRFSLAPSPSAPRNVFIPLGKLQTELRMQDRPARSLPEDPINALLMQGGRQDALQAKLAQQIQLEDWGLVLRKPKGGDGPRPGYLSLESKQMFIEPEVAPAVENAGWAGAPTLVTIVNNLATTRHLAAAAAAALAPPEPLLLLRPLVLYYGPLQVPYFIAAAVEPERKAPLGPFRPEKLEDP